MGWEPPWKHLVEDLKREGFESPYLDRLQQKLHVYLDRPSLEQEILQEMAHALGRAEDKINVALLELDVLGHDLDATSDPATRAELASRFNAKREQAARAVWELRIHREALGLRHHAALHTLYPIPARRA